MGQEKQGIASFLDDVANTSPTRQSSELATKEDQTKEVFKLIQKAKINLANTPEKPPTFFSIGKIDVCTLGNFSCIIGKAKSRKSTLVTAFAASALSGQALGIDSPQEDKKKILYFDTEQGGYHAHLCGKTVLALAGSRPTEQFELFALRPYTKDQRLAVIEHLITSSPDLGLVIIDGVRDLVSDINCATQATFIAGKLLEWTYKYNIHIITILHQNKGDNHARGHLGTEIMNKAELVLSVTKEPDTPELSTVKAEYSRGQDFAPFSFGLDPDRVPYLASLPTPRSNKRTSFDDLTFEAHKDVLLAVFDGGQELKRSKLLTNLKEKYLELFQQKIGDNNLRSFLKEHLANGHILQKGKKPQTKYHLGTFD